MPQHIEYPGHKLMGWKGRDQDAYAQAQHRKSAEYLERRAALDAIKRLNDIRAEITTATSRREKLVAELVPRESRLAVMEKSVKIHKDQMTVTFEVASLKKRIAAVDAEIEAANIRLKEEIAAQARAADEQQPAEPTQEIHDERAEPVPARRRRRA